MSKRPESFVRLRGLPYSAKENDVRQFFADLGLDPVDIQFTTTSEGRPSGECYVEFSSAGDAQRAQQKHQATMGSRYVEVFAISDVELDQLMRRAYQRAASGNSGFVRVRGLPYSCRREELIGFFKGFSVEEIVFGKEPGERGRPTGEAYVAIGPQGASSGPQEAHRALDLNGQHMGHRYLELFVIDADAFDAFKQRMNAPGHSMPLRSLSQSMGHAPGGFGAYGPGGGGGGGAYRDYYPTRDYGYEPAYGGRGGPPPRGGGPGPYRVGPPPPPVNYRHSPYDYHGRGGGGGGYGGGYGGGGYENGAGGGRGDLLLGPTKVYMRGIPWHVTPHQIDQFFAPLNPVDIKTGYYDDGRSTGDAIVEFSTMAEAREALCKDRQCINNRYIELFPAPNMKLPPGARYKSISGGGGMGGGVPPAPPPMPLSATGYQWSAAY
ncbi:RNA recognition domain-containing protein [Aphelenchoides avenae]|nr:RNA recognition domain-containing protein [Aphelenchus avenae]